MVSATADDDDTVTIVVVVVVVIVAVAGFIGFMIVRQRKREAPGERGTAFAAFANPVYAPAPGVPQPDLVSDGRGAEPVGAVAKHAEPDAAHAVTPFAETSINSATKATTDGVTGEYLVVSESGDEMVDFEC